MCLKAFIIKTHLRFSVKYKDNCRKQVSYLINKNKNSENFTKLFQKILAKEE